MTNTNVSLEWANKAFAALVGQYVWFVRCSEDRILQMEFGEPYLDIRILKKSSERVDNAGEFAISRRLVLPKGQWSLFVEDGLWRVDATDLHCTRTDDDMHHFDLCFSRLIGQKLQSASINSGSSVLYLTFDLGGCVNIEFNVDFEENCQWILFSKDEWNLAYCANKTIEYGNDNLSL